MREIEHPDKPVIHCYKRKYGQYNGNYAKYPKEDL
jgi:hypothetical protein